MAQPRCVCLFIPLRQHAYVLLLTDASRESHARARVSLQVLNFDQVRQIVTPTTMPTIITKIMEKNNRSRRGIGQFCCLCLSAIISHRYDTRTEDGTTPRLQNLCRIVRLYATCNVSHKSQKIFFLLTPPSAFGSHFVDI